MRITIIDDEKPARDELTAIVKEYCEDAEICAFASGEKALEYLVDEPMDLAFVDIQLLDMSGIVMAKMLRKMDNNVRIVFATAYNDHAAEAYDLEAYGYILKPYEEHKIEKLIIRVQNELAQQKDIVKKLSEKTKHSLGHEFGSGREKKLAINTQKKTILLDIRDIVYAEIENRSCIIHTLHGSYSCNYTMNMLEEKLKEYSFFRIQKSYLIQLKYILEIYPWFNNTTCVKMKGYEEVVLTVGRGQVKELKEMFE